MLTKKKKNLTLAIISIILTTLLISCTSTHKNENLKVNFPCFPDPILEDNSRAYSIPHRVSSYEEIDDYVLIPKHIWETYNVWEDEVIIPEWYWISLGIFVIDYEAAIERLNIYEGIK